MEKAKRARKTETPKQPSLCLRLRAPYLYPDHMPAPRESTRTGYRITTDSADSRKFRTGSYSYYSYPRYHYYYYSRPYRYHYRHQYRL